MAISEIHIDTIKAELLANMNGVETIRCGNGSVRVSRSWTDCGMSDVREWITNGFHSDAFQHSGEFTLTSPRRRNIWHESDGDPDIDRLLDADESPFRVVRKVREARTGITIHIETGWLADTDASVITAYGAWIARLVASLEAAGHDLEITYGSVLSNLRMRGDEVNTERIILKKFGELSDFTSWSVMFSPAGHRVIAFAGYHIVGKRDGWKVNGGLGAPLHEDWDVTYDDGILTLKNPNSTREFPEADMDEKLRKLGL